MNNKIQEEHFPVNIYYLHQFTVSCYYIVAD